MAGTALLVLGVIDSQAQLLSPLMSKTVLDWVHACAIVGGGVVTLFNQSAHPGHISIPVEEAKRVGVAPEQTKGK